MAIAELHISIKPVNQLTDKVMLQVGDAEIIIPATTILQSIFGKATEHSKPSTIPRIGELWREQGGIYAGVMRGRDGGPDYHLLVGDAVNQLELVAWDKAMAAAKDMRCEVYGHKDYTLPYRAEQSLLLANVPELFDKEWYWSCEQHAATAVSAWSQNFGDGNQDDWHKGSSNRARAVRRLNLTI